MPALYGQMGAGLAGFGEGMQAQILMPPMQMMGLMQQPGQAGMYGAPHLMQQPFSGPMMMDATGSMVMSSNPLYGMHQAAVPQQQQQQQLMQQQQLLPSAAEAAQQPGLA